MADRADAVSGLRPPVWLLALIAGLQLVALVVLLWLPMPSLGGPGGQLRRLFFLMEAVPGLVPGSRFAETTPGRLAEGLRHVENLPQRLGLLGWAGLIACAAMGLGRALLIGLGLEKSLRTGERSALTFGLGATILGVATLALGRSGWLGIGLVRGMLGALALVWALLEARGWKSVSVERADRGWRAVGLILAPVIGLLVLGALQPTIEYDALEYHLQGPKEWFEQGRITFLAHNVYTAMPFSVEMLTLLGMTVSRDWYEGALIGQVLIAGFAVATAVMVAASCERLGAPRAGIAAGLIYLTTPWVFRLGVFPFVEGPLCFYHAALWFLAACMFRGRVGLVEPTPPARQEWESTSTPAWLVTGLLAGGAMACKYPGLITAVLPVGAVATWTAWRRSRIAVLAAYAIGVAIVIGPWLLKNILDTGNPVYPLAFEVFGGREWSEAARVKWDAAHGPRPVSMNALAEGLAGVWGRSDWQSPLYLLFVPLAFARRETRTAALALGGYAAYVFAAWFLLTHRLERFWMPLLPALAVLAGLGVDWLRPPRASWSAWSAALIGIGTVANLSFISTPLCGPTEWTGDMRRARDQAIEVNPPLAELDRSLPAGSKVLIVGQAGVFFLDRPKWYNTVFNREWIEVIASGRGPGEVGRELAARGVTHVYVDWAEVERHRKPGGYGFSPFVTTEVFDGLVRGGVLGPARPISVGGRHTLYEVRPGEARP